MNNSSSGLSADTLEYIKLSGKLMAIDRSHTKNIFKTTLRRVLFRPKRIG